MEEDVHVLWKGYSQRVLERFSTRLPGSHTYHDCLLSAPDVLQEGNTVIGVQIVLIILGLYCAGPSTRV